MSHRRIRKIKNRKHQILLSRKGNRRKRRFRSLCQKRIQSKRQPIKQGRVVSIKDTKLGNEFCPQMLLEYSSLFPHEELNIHEEISNFPREQLVKIVFVLGRNYGTYKISDLPRETIFLILNGFVSGQNGENRYIHCSEADILLIKFRMLANGLY